LPFRFATATEAAIETEGLTSRVDTTIAAMAGSGARRDRRFALTIAKDAAVRAQAAFLKGQVFQHFLSIRDAIENSDHDVQQPSH